jgi:hypothetical protein
MSETHALQGGNRPLRPRPHRRGVESYRKALAVNAALAMAWNGSRWLAKQGDLDGAIDAARQYVAWTREPLAHTSLSMLYQQKGMIPEAEQEKAISMQLQMKHGR